MPSTLLYPSVHRLISLSRRSKRAVMLTADMLAVPVMVWLAFSLRFNSFAPPIHDPWIFLAAPLVLIPALYMTGFYKSIVRYLGAEVAWSMLTGVTASVIVLAALSYMIPEATVPRSVFLIWGMLSMLYLGGSRFVMRRFLVYVLGGVLNRQPVAVFGAGGAGAQLVAGLQSSAEMFPAMVVDDAFNKQGTLLAGVPVVDRKALEKACRRGKVTSVLLAVPSLSRSQRMAIVRWLETLNVKVQTVPAFSDIASGKARIEEIKDVSIEDLLGRDSVPPKQELLHRCISGKHVLVTGAGGSIGSELCRQILTLKPSCLILFEQSELSLYAIEKEMAALIDAKGLQVELCAMLGSVVNRGHIERVCREFRVDTVYHAAAYKHVPIVEANPSAGVRNNILGTLESAQGAEAAGVNPDGDIAIAFTGLRPGEKLYEELLIGECSVGTEHEMIMQATEERLTWDEIQFALESFRKALEKGDKVALKSLLRSYVVGYEPGSSGNRPLESMQTRELPRLVSDNRALAD